MKSLQLKRVASGAVVAIAAIMVVSIPSPALADPDRPPDNASEALKEYQRLSRKATQLNEAHLRAQDDLKTNQRRMATARRQLQSAEKREARARVAEARYRKVVNKFAGATYKGGRLDSVSAALSGGSVRDYLDRSATIDVLAGQKAAALRKLTGAIEQAEQAQLTAKKAGKVAKKARDKAAQNAQDIESRGEALQEQIAEAKDAYDELSGADRDQLTGDEAEVPSNITAPGPEAQTAVDAAMSQRGKPYEWGAEGPDSYDCSGLTSWAYSQAGISIPRSSSAQSQDGTPIDKSQLAPGDLVFFYSPVSHVGMYIGDGKMVHAPQDGDVVHVAEVMWDDYVGARRYA